MCAPQNRPSPPAPTALEGLLSLYGGLVWPCWVAGWLAGWLAEGWGCLHLQQSLNMLKGQTKPLRKRIEERFDEIKTITENAASPYLGAELQYWSGNLPLRVPFPST